MLAIILFSNEFILVAVAVYYHCHLQSQLNCHCQLSVTVSINMSIIALSRSSHYVLMLRALPKACLTLIDHWPLLLARKKVLGGCFFANLVFKSQGSYWCFAGRWERWCALRPALHQHLWCAVESPEDIQFNLSLATEVLFSAVGHGFVMFCELSEVVQTYNIT